MRTFERDSGINLRATRGCIGDGVIGIIPDIGKDTE